MQVAGRPPMPPHQASFGGNLAPQQSTQLLARGVNPAMIQALQNTPGSISRQLGLLGVARNQQPQNGPVPLNIQPQVLQQALSSQSGLGRTPFQQGLFQGQAEPGRPHLQNTVPTSAGANSLQQALLEYVKGPDGRLLPHEAIRVKVIQLRQEIEAIRRQVAQLSTSSSSEIIPMIRQYQTVIQAKEALYIRLQQYLNAAFQSSGPPPTGDGGEMSGGPRLVASACFINSFNNVVAKLQ